MSVLIRVVFVAAFLAAPVGVFAESWDGDRCVFMRDRSDLIFSGTVVEREAGVALFDVAFVHKGPKTETIVVEVDKFDVGEQARVYANREDGRWVAHDCSKKAEIRRYIYHDERDMAPLEATYQAPLSRLTETIFTGCDATRLSLFVRIDGTLALIDTEPDQAFRCALQKARTEKFVPIWDEYPLEWSASKDHERLSGWPYYVPSVWDLVGPLVFDDGWGTRKSEETLRRCVSLDRDRFVDWVTDKHGRPDLQEHLCGLFLRDETRINRTEFEPGLSGFLLDELRPFARERPISSDTLVRERIDQAYLSRLLLRSPTHLEMAADAWAQSGDARKAGLAYWRLASLEPQHGVLWREMSMKVYPEEDPLRARIDRVLSEWRAYREGVYKGRDDAAAAGLNAAHRIVNCTTKTKPQSWRLAHIVAIVSVLLLVVAATVLRKFK